MEVRAAIDELKRRRVPFVPLTSKTEDELRDFFAELGPGGIGAYENGAGIISGSGTQVLEKAVPVATLAVRIEELSRLARLPLRPVPGLSTAEIIRVTGLSADRVPAMLARRFGLPFLAPDGARDALEAALGLLPGLRLTRGGLFWHLSGNHGKEDALDLLLRTRLVSRPLAGFGDAPNDADFLARCDVAVLIPGPSGAIDPTLAASVPTGRVAPFPAGRGWAAAVHELIEEAS